MNNAMYTTLQELVLTAEALNRNLILDEKIILISYNKKGNIKSTHRYEYDDNDIKDLEKYLKQIAADHRKKWKPEFKLFASTIENLRMTLVFELANVELHDTEGNIYLYNYNENGLRDFTEDITDALLAKHDTELDERKTTDCCGNYECDKHEKECSNCHKEAEQGINKCLPENCQDCDNDHCKKNPNAALLIWNKLDQDQQKLISSSLSPEEQEVLFAALEPKNSNS